MMNPSANITLLLHGGSGRVHSEPIPLQKEQAYTQALGEAVEAGFAILQNRGTAIEAVETTIKILEDSPLFNAGRGAVFSNDEIIELDASIMEGHTLKAGAVAGVKTIKHPIAAARCVMEKSDHVMMIGAGAEKFAAKGGLQMVVPSYFITEERRQQIQRLKKEEEALLSSGQQQSPHQSKYGTVGAVALDSNGHLAAGTSTGGMLNKKYGRVGDSPIIGAGTYASAVCAVSATGHGEFFIRYAVAHDVAALMEYKKVSVVEAAAEVIFGKVAKGGGAGGVIALDASGAIATPHNTEGMFWASRKAHSKPHINVCNMIIA